jgi:hypothetical protein
MKKLFAISLILVIAASAAFAEVTVGGQAGIGVTVISGDSAEDSALKASGRGGGRVDVIYANDEGTFGAFVRVKPLNWDGSEVKNLYATGTDRVFAWWQPLSQLKLTLGVDGNGQFGLQYIVGWGWHANDAEDFVASYNGYGFTRGAWSFGGFGGFGAVLTLTPIDGLAINVAVPYKDSGAEAPDVYNQMIGQLTYNIADVGEIGVTYDSGAGYRDWSANDPGAVHAQFYLTAIQNLQLNIGLKYTFAGTSIFATGTEVTTTPPITAGFGLNYNISDTIGVKARLAAGFAGSEKTGDNTIDDPLQLGFDLMPYFDLSILKLNINLGIEYTDEQKNGDTVIAKSAFAWYVNPYITKSAGGGTFYAGFELYSDGVKDSDDKTVIKWGIPIGIQVGF